MKKNLTLFLMCVLFFAVSVQTYAVSQTPQNNSLNIQDNIRIQTQSSREAEIKKTAVDNLKNKAKQQIENRIEILNKLINKVDQDKKLRDQDKQTLKAEINPPAGGQISKLAGLISSLNQTSDETAIRNIYNQVLSEKIYAYFVQKINLLIAIKRLSALQLRLEELSARIQPLINKLSAEGEDVVKLQNALNDTNTRLAEIKTIIEDNKLVLNQTTPALYKDSFVKVRQDLAKIRTNFAGIRADIAKLRGEFNIIRNATSGLLKTPTSTPSATPTIGI